MIPTTARQNPSAFFPKKNVTGGTCCKGSAQRPLFPLQQEPPPVTRIKTRKKAEMLLIIIVRRKGQNHEQRQHHFKIHYNLLPIANQTRMAYAFEILKILCLQLLTYMLILINNINNSVKVSKITASRSNNPKTKETNHASHTQIHKGHPVPQQI